MQTNGHARSDAENVRDAAQERITCPWSMDHAPYERDAHPTAVLHSRAGMLDWDHHALRTTTRHADVPAKRAGLMYDVCKVIEAAEDALRVIVAEARRDGATWAQIGATCGITRQAAQKRYDRA